MTEHRIEYSPESEYSLDQIAEYLAEQSEGAPFIVLSMIRDKISQLKKHPRLGEIFSARPRLRRVVAGSYLVFYEVKDEQQKIRIADIIHSARQSEIDRLRDNTSTSLDPSCK